MKSIQMLVCAYYLIKSSINNSNINKIEMINARNKLKVYKGPSIECNLKNKYSRNKYLAVEYCKNMIVNQDNKFIELYNKSKKKDDLSDSYLQSIYYIEK